MAPLHSFAISTLRAAGHSAIADGLREISDKPFPDCWALSACRDQQCHVLITQTLDQPWPGRADRRRATAGWWSTRRGCPFGNPPS